MDLKDAWLRFGVKYGSNLIRYNLNDPKTLDIIGRTLTLLGEPSLKKNGKIWEKFPIRLDPSPPRIIQNFLNFRHFF